VKVVTANPARPFGGVHGALQVDAAPVGRGALSHEPAQSKGAEQDERPGRQPEPAAALGVLVGQHREAQEYPADREPAAATANSGRTGIPNAATWVLTSAPTNAPMLQEACRRDMIGPAPACSTAIPFAFIDTSIVPWQTPKISRLIVRGWRSSRTPR
jgi:hypothetical protein